MAVSRGQFYMPGANTTGYNNMQPPSSGFSPEYKAQLAEQNRIKKLVLAYKANPSQYDEDEAIQLQQLAVQAGVPMSIQSEPGAKWIKGGLSALDTALFGLLPNDMYTPVNAAERKAVGYGSMAGLLVPWGGPFRLAGAAAKGLKAAGTLAMGGKAAKGIKGSKGILAQAMEGFGNPYGVGKYLPGFSKGAKATTRPKIAPYKGKNDRDFFRFMGQTTKKGSGFNRFVAKGKNAAEKEKLAYQWLKENMDPASFKRIGRKRLQGWAKSRFNPTKKAPKTKVPKWKDKDGNVINPRTGEKFTDKELIEISSKQGGTGNPFLDKIVREEIKRRGNKPLALPSPNATTTPISLPKTTKPKLTPKQKLIQVANQRRNKQTGGNVANKGQKVSNATARVLKSKTKKLNKRQYKELLTHLSVKDKMILQSIKDTKLKYATAKRFAKRLNLT